MPEQIQIVSPPKCLLFPIKATQGIPMVPGRFSSRLHTLVETNVTFQRNNGGVCACMEEWICEKSVYL